MNATQEQITELKSALKAKHLSAYHKRIQAVYLRSQKLTYKAISDLIGLSHDTIWRLVKKYEQEGLSALTHDARGGRHRSYLTYEEEKAFLEEQFVGSASGQFVTIAEMHEAYQTKIGKQTTREGFYALLKRHGWRKVTPRPEHPKKQMPKRFWRLKIKSTFKKTRKRFKNSRRYQKVRLMYQDEAGFGRISKIGKSWVPKGVRPHVHSHYIREYRYCYGAVDAHTGESFFIIAGGCNTDWMNEFLRQLSQAYPNDYILLVMDNAVWHKSRTLEKPTNIGFEFIPPYTPEMNPIEQVWAEIRKRGFKNKAFKTLDDVINKLQEVIQCLHWSVLKPIVHRNWLFSDFDVK
ncbi:IS630 family transposase [Streptococcus himalayensis]